MIGGVRGLVLDATSLADLAERRTEFAAELVDTAIDNLRVVCVPAAALMECWAQSAEKSQAFLAMFTGLSIVVVADVNLDVAIDAGVLAADAGEPDATAGTMQAVHAAATRGWPLLTEDPAAARRLSEDVMIVALP